MILLPYAHERQTVQRLPWITFSLIALNFIIFLLTHYGGSNINEFLEKQQEVYEYYYTHPYLDLPQDARQFFDEEELEDLNTLKQATNRGDMDALVLMEEQRELDKRVRELLRIENENPYERFGYVPSRPNLINLVTATFIHGGWLHLIGNMLFLYLAGCSIEDVWGRPLYIGFYVISGAVASLVHQLQFPESTEPLVGASGAIAGLMGAFLVRLYNTRISFFYMLGFWYRGTFQAPAYIMLPLWLGEQLLYAFSDPSGDAGVAFWAHIGGFVFGAGFAVAIKYGKIEERYITPAIEKKISLAQNPNFLKGMDLSEQGNYAEALIYLTRAVKEEPNHVDAYMEMKRIAEMNGDSESFNKYSAAIIDILLRNKEYDLMLDMYRSHQECRLQQTLPAKTLFGLSNYFEESGEFDQAADHYTKIVTHYTDELTAMKAHNKLSRIYFDRLNDRAKAVDHFWKSYYHKQATDQWRSALQLDIRKYSIPQVDAPAATAAVPDLSTYEPSEQTAAAAAAPLAAAATSFQPHAAFKPPAQATVAAPAPSSRRHDTVSARPQPSQQSSAPFLPDPAFDGTAADSWQVVPCTVEKIGLKGLELRNEQQHPGFLFWKKISFVSVARIKNNDPKLPERDREILLIDLIHTTGGKTTVYRTDSRKLSFEKIFPRVEQTFLEAFQNFAGIVLNNSLARCVPNRESCLGPTFANYPDVERYEARVKDKITLRV